tara:strand:+ start:798 stop:1634 length:837 start_codon:yes stop_codon:yes gene_type:complete
MKIESYINCENLDKDISKISSQYRKAEPFPHIILDNFLKENCISNTLKGFKKVKWSYYNHFNEKKSANKTNKLDPLLKRTIEACNSEEFIARLEKITGIPDLIPDHKLGSGGVHRSSRGGYLNIHADFTVHPYNNKWHRRVNLLIYLNQTWEESWGGQLELWDKKMSHCVKKITPIFNRCVIFNTDYDSFHGHPEPMKCPPNVNRMSIALYYYTNKESNVRTVATNYKGRPVDKTIKKIFIFFDKILVGFFHFLKSKFKISDRVVTRIFDFLNFNKKN